MTVEQTICGAAVRGLIGRGHGFMHDWRFLSVFFFVTDWLRTAAMRGWPSVLGIASDIDGRFDYGLDDGDGWGYMTTLYA